MKFMILGSGGALRIPRACCFCPVCCEARSKGFPYKRLGQSLYLVDERILFDTPDHTLGCRIIESLAEGKQEPVSVYVPKGGLDISINGNALFDYLDYVELVKRLESI